MEHGFGGDSGFLFFFLFFLIFIRIFLWSMGLEEEIPGVDLDGSGPCSFGGRCLRTVSISEVKNRDGTLALSVGTCFSLAAFTPECYTMVPQDCAA